MIFLALLLLTLCSLLFTPPVHAQLEIAETFDVPKEAIDGDIVSYIGTGISLSGREYDDKIFGVVVTSPLAAYRRVDNSGLPVLRSGTALINVTTINGPLKKGDFITSSHLPGKGQKALISGYVVGVAMEDFSESDGESINYTPPEGGAEKAARSGKINAAIKIEFAELNTARNANRLLDAINAALFRNINDPEKFVNIIRYILAGLAVLISFIIGFFTLARVIPKGVEALGRNPLARGTIQFGMILNILFTLGIAVLGIVAAIILLRF